MTDIQTRRIMDIRYLSVELQYAHKENDTVLVGNLCVEIKILADAVAAHSKDNTPSNRLAQDAPFAIPEGI